MAARQVCPDFHETLVKNPGEEEEIAMALCTECEAEIDLATGTEVGEIIQCPDCGLDLEVLSVDPAELAAAPEEEEDWGE